MKTKISISLDEETVLAVEKLIVQERGAFRNKSHFIEVATQKMLEEKNG